MVVRKIFQVAMFYYLQGHCKNELVSANCQRKIKYLKVRNSKTYNNSHLFNVRVVTDQHLESNFRSCQHELPAAEEYFP